MQGRPKRLIEEEETIIAQRLVHAASRKCDVDIDGVETIMGQVAADRRPGWKDG